MAVLERYFSWVMNPSIDRKGRKLMDKILPESLSKDTLPIQSAEPEVVILNYTSSLIDRNIYMYTLVLSGPERKLDKLARMIGELSYQPLRFTLDNVDRDPIQVKSVLSIISTMLYRDYHIKVNSIGVRKNLSLDTIDIEPYMSFTAPDFDRKAYSASMVGHEPVSFTYTLDLEGEQTPSAGYTIPIYTSEEDSMMMKTSIDVNELVGYRMLVEPSDEVSLVLAGSPLIWVALKDTPFVDRFYDDDVIMANGLALIKISTDSNNPDIMAAEGFDMGRQLAAAVNNYIDMGVFTVTVPLNDPTRVDLYQEIAYSFGMSTHGYYKPNVVKGSKVNYIFYQPISTKYYIKSVLDGSWMVEALDSITRNSVPLISITGPWVYEFDATISNIARLQYMAIKAMAQLSTVSKNGVSPELLRFISEIKALPDLTLVIPALTLKDVVNIQSHLTMQMKGSNFYMEKCEDLSDAVVKRWTYQKSLPNVKWLIIKLGNSEYLCGDTVNPQARGKLPNVRPEDKAQVIQVLVDYFRDACLIDKVDAASMSSLDQLLNVVLADSVCYSRHDKDIRYLSIERNTSDMNFRGVYSMGEFKGILDHSLPAYGVIDKTVDVGTITVDKLIEDTYVVSASLEKTIMELFSIQLKSTDEVNEIYAYVRDLWSKGWFLKSWASYWYRTRGMISELEPRRNFVLGLADRNTEDAERASNLLRKTSEMLA